MYSDHHINSKIIYSLILKLENVIKMMKLTLKCLLKTQVLSFTMSQV